MFSLFSRTFILLFYYQINPSFDNKSMNSFHSFKHLIPKLYTPPLWGGLVKEKNINRKETLILTPPPLWGGLGLG